jgi:hypothetical protein
METNLLRISAVLFIVALLVLSALTVSSAYGQTSSIPKPVVPAFTAQLIDNSYDVPASTSIDPYNGQTINNTGYHVENYTIELTIVNQPFSPITVYEGTSNWTANFYYNVRTKGHFANEWITLYSPDSDYPKKSTSQFTIIAYSTRGDNGFEMAGGTFASNPGDQIDYQVKAMIGYVSRVYDSSATNQLEMFPWKFTGQESGWSSTQTVTLPGNAATTTPNTSSSPTQTNPTINTGPVVNSYGGLSLGEIIIISILAVIAVLLAILTIVMHERKKK